MHKVVAKLKFNGDNYRHLDVVVRLCRARTLTAAMLPLG